MKYTASRVTTTIGGVASWASCSADPPVEGVHPLICAGCGERVDVPQVREPGVLVCAACGHGEPFARLPLFCLTGPSGTGKSTVARLLIPRVADRVVVLEQDLLWQAGLDDPTDEHRLFRSTWLRLAAAVGQNGRDGYCCAAPWCLPSSNPCPSARCSPASTTSPSPASPACSPDGSGPARCGGSGDKSRIAEALDHAAWLGTTASRLHPPVDLLDTTSVPPATTVEQVDVWLDRLLTQ